MVWRTARRLHAALAGRRLETAELRWPSLATADLSGRDVLEVISAGKHILTRIDGDLTLHSHLRMEGSWHVHAAGEAWRTRRADHAVRAILANAEWTAIGHRLGMLDLVRTSEEDQLVGHLGPDVLGPDWDPAEAARRIRATPDRTIGEALLDQRVLAGVGTFYMAEGLFLRGLSPWTPVRDVADVDALVRMEHRLLATNKDRAVQVTTGDARKGRSNYVHSRSGLPCRRCGTPIRVAELGAAPQQRTAFWCPHCQPGPAPVQDAPPTPLGSSRRPSPTGGARSYRTYRP